MSPETEQIVSEVRCSLEGAAISQAFLFGSRASEEADGESDVDVVVILEREEPFASFKERSAVLVDLRRRLSRISSNYGLDLLLFTRREWNTFVENGSSFSREIQKGALKVA